MKLLVIIQMKNKNRYKFEISRQKNRRTYNFWYKYTFKEGFYQNDGIIKVEVFVIEIFLSEFKHENVHIFAIDWKKNNIETRNSTCHRITHNNNNNIALMNIINI